MRQHAGVAPLRDGTERENSGLADFPLLLVRKTALQNRQQNRQQLVAQRVRQAIQARRGAFPNVPLGRLLRLVVVIVLTIARTPPAVRRRRGGPHVVPRRHRARVMEVGPDVLRAVRDLVVVVVRAEDRAVELREDHVGEQRGEHAREVFAQDIPRGVLRREHGPELRGLQRHVLRVVARRREEVLHDLPQKIIQRRRPQLQHRHDDCAHPPPHLRRGIVRQRKQHLEEVVHVLRQHRRHQKQQRVQRAQRVDADVRVRRREAAGERGDEAVEGPRRVRVQLFGGVLADLAERVGGAVAEIGVAGVSEFN
mmetsp:Transcript_16380/g.42238  ORF Transcript_16380/g.42238 Transcript_16380/m.42238 type:complete len:310 (+) Transcript_16380:2053-2982(+)